MNDGSMDPELPAAVQDLFDADLRRALIALRRAIHADPELTFQEERTAQKLERALAPIAAGVRRVAKTGVIARIRGRDSRAPLVAIRGDIDALPVREETGLPFASHNEGVMHACGHDIHATWAVGAAALLANAPAQGDVLIVLQPAEETGHGAPADMFEIELVGQGAHAARPHESADPIVGLGALIGAIQTIVSRRLNPANPGIVTIGTVRAGTASNVIPERATLTGTVRAVDAPSRKLMLDEVRRVAESTAATYRLTANVKLDPGTP